MKVAPSHSVPETKHSLSINETNLNTCMPVKVMTTWFPMSSSSIHVMCVNARIYHDHPSVFSSAFATRATWDAGSNLSWLLSFGWFSFLSRFPLVFLSLSSLPPFLWPSFVSFFSWAWFFFVLSPLLHLHVLFLGLLMRATLAICLALAMVHLTDIGIAVGRSFQNTWPLRIDSFLFGGTLSGATGHLRLFGPLRLILRVAHKESWNHLLQNMWEDHAANCDNVTVNSKTKVFHGFILKSWCMFTSRLKTNDFATLYVTSVTRGLLCKADPSHHWQRLFLRRRWWCYLGLGRRCCLLCCRSLVQQSLWFPRHVGPPCLKHLQSWQLNFILLSLPAFGNMLMNIWGFLMSWSKSVFLSLSWLTFLDLMEHAQVDDIYNMHQRWMERARIPKTKVRARTD